MTRNSDEIRDFKWDENLIIEIVQRIREWKLQETVGHPYNFTRVHTRISTKLNYSLCGCCKLYLRVASSMYYIEPVTVRRSITPRIATIITSNHLLRGIFDVSLDMYVSSELSLRSENTPEQLLFRITEMQENAQVFKLSMNERIVSTSVFVHSLL